MGSAQTLSSHCNTGRQAKHEHSPRRHVESDSHHAVCSRWRWRPIDPGVPVWRADAWRRGLVLVERPQRVMTWSWLVLLGLLQETEVVPEPTRRRRGRRRITRPVAEGRHQHLKLSLVVNKGYTYCSGQRRAAKRHKPAATAAAAWETPLASPAPLSSLATQGRREFGARSRTYFSARTFLQASSIAMSLGTSVAQPEPYNS